MAVLGCRSLSGARVNWPSPAEHTQLLPGRACHPVRRPFEQNALPGSTTAFSLLVRHTHTSLTFPPGSPHHSEQCERVLNSISRAHLVFGHEGFPYMYILHTIAAPGFRPHLCLAGTISTGLPGTTYNHSSPPSRSPSSRRPRLFFRRCHISVSLHEQLVPWRGLPR